MKRQSAVFIVIATTLAACGGSSSGGGNDPVEAPEAIEPVVVPEPVVQPAPIDMPVNDALDVGELALLLGSVGVAYSFTTTEAIFTISTSFTDSDVLEADNGDFVLVNNAITRIRADENSEFVTGPSYIFSCAHVSEDNVNLCLLDPSGDLETVFLFSAIVNGEALGSFEFCNGLQSGACLNDLASTPDGIAAISVLPGTIARLPTDPGVALDTTPYIQYMKQGTAPAKQNNRKIEKPAIQAKLAVMKAIF